jgi:hypothetical protein
MIKNNVVYFVAIFLVNISCSKKLTMENLNKPFYSSFEKNVKKTYKEFEGTILFENYYSNEKYEIDRSVKFRNKVVDSLNLIDKDKWLLVRLNSTNYSGAYEKTFIIFDDKCVYYSLPKPDDSLGFIVKECKVEELQKLNNKDVLNIYKSFEDGNFDKIKSEPDTNPLLSYKIISVKDKKISSYKLNSKDYIFRKWY